MSIWKRFLWVVGLCAVALPGAAFADTKSQLEARAKEWMDKYNAGDAPGVAAMYAEDAQLLPPQSEPIAGRAAIQEFWQGAMTGGLKGAFLELLEVHAGGNFATEVGRYTMKNAEGQEVDRGKYMVLWKKQKGVWLLVRDMWSTSVTAAPAAK